MRLGLEVEWSTNRNSSPVENLSAADQASEEAFAQPIFDLLKSSIVPELGHPQVPERAVIHFAETLRKASSLWSYDSTAGEARALGTTANIRGTAQERVASWCLDVLVAAVQGDAQGELLASPNASADRKENQQRHGSVSRGCHYRR